MLTGVGGQGTVLMSRLIGSAAIAKGYAVRGTETIGMAQRGGSVVSHVRLGDEIHSPLIPLFGADLLIAFEPAEAVRALPFLKPGGTVLVIDRAVRPASSALSGDYNALVMIEYLKQTVENLIVIDGEELICKCKTAKVMNVALLGVAVKHHLLPFTMEDAERVLKERLPGKFLEINLHALHVGADE
jgi:indolepyruvate ferredoxin oxidoreductase beta subunit